MQENKNFKMIDESFTCQVCNKEILPLGYTARDHCPHCLSSIHIDNNPGDRQSDCHGILRPIGIEKSKKGSYKIVYRCEKCKMVKKNIAAKDDNTNLIIKLSSIPLQY